MSQSEKIPPLDARQVRISCDLMRALAHPLRLRIISLLNEHDAASVQSLYTELGVEQSVVSQHLRILRQSGLVRTDRQGKFVYYLLNLERIATAARVADQLIARLPKTGKKKDRALKKES